MDRKIKNNKIIVIVGTTASGKTSLAVDLAWQFKGEVVSADSRQVYKGMDIGTGKDLDEYVLKIRAKSGQIQNVNIPYHLIDVVRPNTDFNLAKFKKRADKAVADILTRGKLPIIAGGTGLYVQALVDDYRLSSVRPNRKLRLKLAGKTAKELFDILKKLNPGKANSLNNSDKNNKRRLLRLIEFFSCKVSDRRVKKEIGLECNFLILGIIWPRSILEKRIYKRLVDRLEKEDMVGEVERLHCEGVSWKRLENFGLEYKYIAMYLQGKLRYDEMVEKLFIATRQFAKRQMTWLRRWERQGTEINWLQNKISSKKLIENFLKQ